MATPADTPVHPDAHVYRDVTISRLTRNTLADLVTAIDDKRAGLVLPRELEAIRTVISKWDANTATETTF